MQKTEQAVAKTAAVDAPGIETPTTEPEIIEPFFWRNVTADDVRWAIQDSYLEVIVDALAKNYRRNIPFPLIFSQAVILMSTALTHQGKLPGFEYDDNGDIEPMPNLTPAKLS